MTKKPANEVTGRKAASAASRVLSGNGTKADAKSAAASALSQAPNKGAKSSGKK